MPSISFNLLLKDIYLMPGNFSPRGGRSRFRPGRLLLPNSWLGPWQLLNLSKAMFRWQHCWFWVFMPFLRTGELLSLRAADILLGADAAIVRLRSTKTSARFAADDAVSITDEIVLELVRHLCLVRQEDRCEQLPLWNGTAQSFRVRFQRLCELYGLSHHGFRPYSLRRGGATALFQNSGSMESTLNRGRWQSSRVAKICIQDALSYLPSLKPTLVTRRKLNSFYFISPSQG